MNASEGKHTHVPIIFMLQTHIPHMYHIETHIPLIYALQNTHMHIQHTETIYTPTHTSHHTMYIHICTCKQNFLSTLYNLYLNASCLCFFSVSLCSYFFFKSTKNDLLKPKFSAKYWLAFPECLVCVPSLNMCPRKAREKEVINGRNKGVLTSEGSRYTEKRAD